MSILILSADLIFIFKNGTSPSVPKKNILPEEEYVTLKLYFLSSKATAPSNPDVQNATNVT
jgi:hypothetical protein